MKNKKLIENVLKSFEDKKGWSEIADGALRNKYMIKMDVEWAIEKALAEKDKENWEMLRKNNEWINKKLKEVEDELINWINNEDRKGKYFMSLGIDKLKDKIRQIFEKCRK